MGQAFLDLYAATGNRDWLTAAAKAGGFIATFSDAAGGFFTSKTSEGKTGVFVAGNALTFGLEALVARKRVSRSDAGRYGRATPEKRRRPNEDIFGGGLSA